MDVILILSLLLVVLLFFIKTNKKNVHDPLIKRIKYDVSKLDPRIIDIDFFSSNESYTEDKKRIFLCLKDENGKYYDYNMLMYVAIHECSHALTNVIDMEHITPEFRRMFDFLLIKAARMGLYKPDVPLVEHYCGIDLDTNKMQR